MSRRITLITAAAADWALIEPVMAALATRPEISLSLIACGTLIGAGIPISPDLALDTRLAGIGPVVEAKALGLAVAGMADAFVRFAPHLVVVAGAEPEAMAAAQAALVMRLPLAHLQSPERPEGKSAIVHDAITKMAQLHFTASAPARDATLRLGEQAERVFLAADPAPILAGTNLDGIIVKAFNDLDHGG